MRNLNFLLDGRKIGVCLFDNKILPRCQIVIWTRIIPDLHAHIPHVECQRLLVFIEQLKSSRELIVNEVCWITFLVALRARTEGDFTSFLGDAHVVTVSITPLSHEINSPELYQFAFVAGLGYNDKVVFPYISGLETVLIVQGIIIDNNAKRRDFCAFGTNIK